MTSDIDFFIARNNEKPTQPPPHLISEYIQGRRVLPPGSPMPGPIDLHLTPYAIEIMDSAGPYSGINRISVMKGVQIALTTTIENIIAYYMDANPAEVMYCSATDALLKKWTKRLEPLIDSCGYRHKIASQGELNSKSKRTGDSMYSKEYPGGSLSMTSLQSPAGMRSESNRILPIDEVDAAPRETTTGEGNFLGILEGRTVAYGSTYKIISTSTPATFESSIIYPDFLDGDQRYYNVPCLKCGLYFVFDFKLISPIYDKHGYLDKVYHECPHCNGPHFNHDKTEMMKVGNAYWEPTARPQDKTHRSYHISALYSPVGMMSWERIFQMWLKAEEDPTRKPSFVNLYEGNPYKEEGHRPDDKKVRALRGSYKSKTIPEGILYLTLAADIQRGKEKYQNMTPAELTEEMNRMAQQGKDPWLQGLPRIELEVMGVGHNHCSWSIEYKVIYGHTTLGAYAGAFENFYKWAEETELTYKRGDGVEFAPKIIFFDASDGTTQPTVYDFADRFGYNTFPIVNDGWLKKKKDPGVDEQSRLNFDRYRISSSAKYNKKHIDVSTNHYKGQVYTRINRTLKADKPGIPTYCDFPIDYPDYYFKMLTAEEQRENGSFHDGGRRNEALDIRGYNLCAADVWLDGQVREAQEWAKRMNYSKYDIEQHDKKFILNRLDAKINKGAG